MAQHTDETTRTCPGWGEECGNNTEQGMDLCPDCHMGRLNTQSPRIPR